MRPVLESLEEFIGVLLDAILDVHLASVGRFLFAGDGEGGVEAEGPVLLGGSPEVGVEEARGGRDAEEEPGSAAEGRGRGRALDEEAAHEASKRRDARPGRDHDEVGLVVLGQEHALADRTGKRDGRSRRCVAEEVRADAFLRRILAPGLGIDVDCPPHAERHAHPGPIVAVPAAGDRVEALLVRPTLAVDARRQHADRLPLDVRQAPPRLEDDVADLPGRVGSNRSRHRPHAALERILLADHVRRHLAVLQIVQLLRRRGDRLHRTVHPDAPLRRLDRLLQLRDPRSVLPCHGRPRFFDALERVVMLFHQYLGEEFLARLRRRHPHLVPPRRRHRRPQRRRHSQHDAYANTKLRRHRGFRGFAL
mmetsp:Transcript_15997/g.50153  ORF Transcript_15997/g.50153 Transcript_15997/m.50153 type:complete len:365 (-) Transcript_15997:4-1098(-)